MLHDDSQICMIHICLYMTFYTCTLHNHDMFDEMCVIASRGPIEVLNKYSI